VDSNTGYVVGSGGAIARTKDGGVSWGTLVSGTTRNLLGSDFPAPTTGWVVGASGTIMKTTDGISWTPQVSGVTSQLQGVDFVDASSGFAVGANGVIQATVNGGSTWTTQTSNVPTATTTLYGVSALDAQTAYAWGTSGRIAKTTDGGSTWTTQTISTSALYAGSFVDSQTGWVAGAGGALFKTEDGGANWFSQTSGVSANILGITMLDRLHGLLVGGAGGTSSSFVQETTDGSLWSRQVPGTVNALRAIAFTDPDHGWTVGDLGTILRTTDNTAPETSMTVDPVSPDGSSGWYVSTPTVTLTSDEPGITYYSWVSSGGPWSTFSVPIERTVEGTSSLWYFSADPGGNRETTLSAVLHFDAGQPSIPGTPTTTPLSTNSVSVSWPAATDAVSGVDHYQVRANGNLVAVSATNVVTVSSLDTETAYVFRISAVDAAGNESSESENVTATTLGVVARPPIAVYARAVPGSGAFVNWGETTGTVPPVSYRLWRSINDGAFSAIATLTGESSRSFADTSAPTWKPIRYVVSVVDTRGEGPKSDVAPAATTAASTFPPVGGVVAKNTASVLVTWTPSPYAGVVGYHVYRSILSTAVGTTLTVLPEDQVTGSYHDSSTADYSEYWYRVAAVDASGTIGKLSAAVYVRTEAGSGTVEPPHGAYNQDTDMCALCHSTHLSPSPFSLLRGTTSDEAPLCFTCHDGTSASDVMGEYTSTSKLSRHAVSVGSVTGTLRCSDCHGVHSAEQTDTVKGLLLAGTSKSGNNYCYECHGSSAGANPRGDLTGFEGSSHGANVAQPPTGTKVVCLSCHVSHASAEAGLYPYAPDDRCLGCHTAGSSASGTDIARALSGSGPDTRHDLLAADSVATGSRLSCSNCHEPHTSSATTPCVDPDSPTTSGGIAATDALCLRCHDGSLPTSVVTSGWADAPLAASGEPTTVDLTAGWAASFHGAGPSVAPQLRADMDYAKGDTLTCRSCHDAHGSTNGYALRESISAKTGTLTADALLTVPVPGGADLRFFCASCHIVGPATHPGPLAGGADLTIYPQNCMAGGCHTHLGTGL